MLGRLDKILVHRYGCSVLGIENKTKFVLNRLARKVCRWLGKSIDPLRQPFDLIGKATFISYDGLLFEGFDDGLRICIYPHETHYLRWTMEILSEYERRRIPINVLDVGAHIGSYAIRVAKTMKDRGINGLVIAIEPDPRNAEYLLRNAILNSVEDRIVLLNVCVANANFVARFTIYNRSDHGSLLPRNDSVAVARIDRFCARLDDIVRIPVHIMKIDVEGAEHSVIKGAEKLIAVHRPAILLEVHLGEEELEKIMDKLKPYGYYEVERVVDEKNPRHIHVWLDVR